MKPPDKRSLKTEISKLERQVDDVVETLTEVARSDALTATFRKLEVDKGSPVMRLNSEPAPPEILPKVQKNAREGIRQPSGMRP